MGNDKNFWEFLSELIRESRNKVPFNHTDQRNRFTCMNVKFVKTFNSFLISRFDKECVEVRLEHFEIATLYVKILVFTCMYQVFIPDLQF
jgi:hypothetical protein